MDSYFSDHFYAEKVSLRASKRLQKFRTRKLPKIVNCATIKETGKLKETMVGSKWNRWVATNILLDHSSPLRKQWSPLRWVPPWDEETFFWTWSLVSHFPWWRSWLALTTRYSWIFYWRVFLIYVSIIRSVVACSMQSGFNSVLVSCFDTFDVSSRGGK